MNIEQAQEHQRRVDFGNMAKNFLTSKEWLEIVKPIIDSMVRGVTDVRTMKKADFTSEVKAQAQILAHQMTADYLEKIELLIGAYVVDSEVSRKLLDKQQKVADDSLYKETE